MEDKCLNNVNRKFIPFLGYFQIQQDIHKNIVIVPVDKSKLFIRL